MGNPLANLGDYNIARDALKAVNGNWGVLYKSIGDTAVAKATPQLLRKGGIIGGAIRSAVTAGTIYLGHKAYCFIKDRNQKIDNELTLKKQFAEAIGAELPVENEEPTDGAELN